MKLKLLIICGGQSSEHTISRLSCTSILNNLNRENYELTLAGISQDGVWHRLDADRRDLTGDDWLEGSTVVEDIFGLLKAQDVAFPVLHGLYGEDGTIQGLLELAQVPYVGCRVLSSSVCMDKVYAKRILAAAQIPQVRSVYVKKRGDGAFVAVTDTCEEIREVEDYIEEQVGLPCFIKASRSGSSIGCYRCGRKEEIRARLEDAARYDTHILAEEYIDCIELETAVLGNDDLIVSQVGQIMPHGEFYTFESKYEDEESKTCIPALVDPKIQEQIRVYAARAFRALDGSGFARVDFFLDKRTDRIYLNEVNTIPGFTKISMYPQLIVALGISYSELIDRLVGLAR